MQSSNQEFYQNLRQGLRQLARDKPSQETQSYSKNLGRVEFGNLKNKKSRDDSTDKSVVAPREKSRERRRSVSTALPDLEVEEDVKMNEVDEVEDDVHHRPEVEPPVESIQTRSVQDIPSVITENLASHTEGEAGTEAGRETGGKKQELSDAKAWIQNSLITVVGFGVLAYLQTLEASA